MACYLNTNYLQAQKQKQEIIFIYKIQWAFDQNAQKWYEMRELHSIIQKNGSDKIYELTKHIFDDYLKAFPCNSVVESLNFT